MSVFTDGEELLQLSTDNPKFKLRYNLVLDRLINFRSNDSVEMQKATDLIKAINDKFGFGDITGIMRAFTTYRSDITYNRATDMFLYRVPITDILSARKVAAKFRAVANESMSKGMHKKTNRFALVYAVTLAKEVQKLHSENSEKFWDKYALYKQFVVQAVNKGTLSIAEVPALATLIQIVEKEINDTEYNKNTEKLNVFSRAGDIVDKIRLKEIISEMIYISITDICALEGYFNKQINMINEKLHNNEITVKEFESYNREIRNEYELLLRPDTKDTTAPLIVCAEAMSGKCKYEQLLQFTEEEIIESFHLATGFIKYFTNENLEEMALNCRKLSVSDTKKISEGFRAELDKGSKEYLDILLKYDVITPERYEIDLRILQEG